MCMDKKSKIQKPTRGRFGGVNKLVKNTKLNPGFSELIKDCAEKLIK